MRDSDKPLGWHSRGRLPHFDTLGVLQFVTFRLADSLPHALLAELDAKLASLPAEQRAREQARHIEYCLDQGLGCCALGRPAMAAVMQKALQYFHPERYRLIAWCVMPNHVHVLLEPYISLARIMQSWKSYTARWAHEHWAELELGVPAPSPFWLREYWDRAIRDEAHYLRVLAYIEHNPIKAGLATPAQPWPWQGWML